MPIDLSIVMKALIRKYSYWKPPTFPFKQRIGFWMPAPFHKQHHSILSYNSLFNKWEVEVGLWWTSAHIYHPYKTTKYSTIGEFKKTTVLGRESKIGECHANAYGFLRLK